MLGFFKGQEQSDRRRNTCTGFSNKTVARSAESFSSNALNSVFKYVSFLGTINHFLKTAIQMRSHFWTVETSTCGWLYIFGAKCGLIFTKRTFIVHIYQFNLE